MLQSQLAPQTSSLPAHCTGFMEIDRAAIVHNYHILRSLLPTSLCAPVLKADAYGFGMDSIAPLLAQEGCTTFFVAHLEEGLTLRSLLRDATIYVLSGVLPGMEDTFCEATLTPVVSSMEMLKHWKQHAHHHGHALPCLLHFDTGMNRSGFDHHNITQLRDSWESLEGVRVKALMSHLAASHDPEDPLNAHQHSLFKEACTPFPSIKTSLADTGGIYLGSHYHGDMARPGKGLFGLFKAPSSTPALKSCLKLFARILQVRTAPQGSSVGYGGTYTLTRESKLATLGMGFADGYDRRFSNNANAMIQGFKAPVVGRISMDYTVIDVTDIPESLCFAGGWVELVNETLTLDDLAASIGTISRELSTGFGKRLQRVYR